MADLSQIVRRLPPEQQEAMRRQMELRNPELFQRMRQPMNLAPLAELAVGMLPGAGDVMAAQESQQAGQRMADAFRAGDYGRAASSGLEALGLGLGALPFVPAMGGTMKAFHGTKSAPFERFDASNIGRGAGGNAMGHGVNLTSSSKAARGYGPTVLRTTVDVDDADLLRLDLPFSQQPPKVKDRLASLGLTPKEPEVVQAGEAVIVRSPGAPKKAHTVVKSGEFWRIALPGTNVEVGKYSSKDEAVKVARGMVGDPTGLKIYDALGGGRRAADALRGAGIPGGTYAASSTSAGLADPSATNFVIYDPDLIKIEGVE